MKEQNDVQKLGELIKGIGIAMLTTADDEGRLHSRPMANQNRDFDGTLWFFTNAQSAKVDELERDHQVNLSYADTGDQRYISVSGRATMVRDKQKMEELWSLPLKAWFPKGLEDPNIALLRVEVEKAEYWDSPSSAVVQLIGFAKALATGKRYEGEAADHKKINL